MSFKLGPSTVVNPSGKLFVDSSKWSVVFTDANRPTDASLGDVIFSSDSESLQVWNGSEWVLIGSTAGAAEYFIDSNTQTTITVPSSCNNIKIAGAGEGGAGGSTPAGPSTLGGYSGGGGGGSNIEGYIVNGSPLRGTTLFVSTLENAIVFAGPSTSSPKIFQADQGSGSTGGSVSVGSGIAGGNGGGGGSRDNRGGNGSSAGGTGGGGGGGGYGDNSPPRPGQPGGSGGSSSAGTSITPLGVGPASPWTITSQPGGAGGAAGQPGTFYTTGAQGGTSGGVFYQGGGGGAGGGIVINGVAYGGGGGGGGATGAVGSGAGGGAFIIIQFT